MEKKDFLRKLREAGFTPSAAMYEDYDEDKIETLFGAFETVHEQGGGEGGGEHVEIVIHFKALDYYIEAVGSYYSHDGTHMEDKWYFVEPKEVTVIKYVKPTNK